MKNIKKYLSYLLLTVIFIIAIFIWIFVFSEKNPRMLKVAFLDVGQGDAIFIETPNKKQVLIDGGKDAKLLYSLAKVMPFADRSIDLVIITHYDLDHVGGIPLLLNGYRVDRIIDNGVQSNSEVATMINEKVKDNLIKKEPLERGTRINLDQKRNIYIEILYPDRDVENMDSNDGSVVAKLVYGENSFLFTGDAGLYTENLIMWNEEKENLDIDVLKLGHHGARSSSSIPWLEKTSPELAIISAEKGNSYGHPHKETLERLTNLNIPFLSTAELGTILIKSDGQNLEY